MIRRSIFALALVAVTAVAARAADYNLDVPHTTASFTAIHLAILRVHGMIPFKSGTLQLGPNDLPTGGSATFDVSGVATSDANRDRSLRTSYLETDKYPTMTFVVRKSTGTPQAFDLTGDLTLHGVTKSVTLKAAVVGSTTDRAGKRLVGFTATTTLDRRDFGITFGSGLSDAQLSVGYPIEIDIEAMAVQP